MQCSSGFLNSFIQALLLCTMCQALLQAIETETQIELVPTIRSSQFAKSMYNQIIFRMYTKYPSTHMNRFIPRESGRLLGGGDILAGIQGMILNFISKQCIYNFSGVTKRFKAVLFELFMNT